MFRLTFASLYSSGAIFSQTFSSLPVLAPPLPSGRLSCSSSPGPALLPPSPLVFSRCFTFCLTHVLISQKAPPGLWRNLSVFHFQNNRLCSGSVGVEGLGMDFHCSPRGQMKASSCWYSASCDSLALIGLTALLCARRSSICICRTDKCPPPDLAPLCFCCSVSDAALGSPSGDCNCWRDHR